MSIRGSSFPLESLRRSSWPFVDIFLPFPGNPFSPSRPLAGPSQASSNPLVALRRSSWPFVDIFLPFPGNPFSPSRPLADPSQASSNPLVALRRSSWPFVESFCLFLEIFSPCPTIGGSLLSLLQPLSGPSPFFVALRGYLFAFSWKSFLPLPDPWRPSRPSWPFAVLRGPSWKSFCLFLEIFSPCPTIGGSLSSLLQPLGGPSWSFLPLRG